MRLAGTTIGQFYPGNSVLHRADPRVKFMASLAFVIVLFLIEGYGALAVMAAGIIAVTAGARLPLVWIYRTLKPALWLIVFTLVFQLFLRGGEELTRIGPLPLYRQGLIDGGFLSARLLMLVLSGALLTFTTPPVLLTDALGSLLSPLARLRFPAYQVSLMVTIALRFIPTLLMEVDRIILAQRARGAAIGRGGPVRKARALMPILVPLFVISFRHADELAMAMESRCWRGGRGRTQRRRLRLTGVDAVFGLLLISLLVAALVLSF